MVSRSGELVAGRYRVEAELGRGGSAIVHRAMDTRLERSVALKQMRDGWDERLQRSFLDEARLLASLRHPSLLEVYDAGVDEGGSPYVASRLLIGETLEDAMASSPIEPSVALRLSLPILGALAIAHDQGVVHRDVKPSNIFLERRPDGGLCPVLLDFGIARRDTSDRGESVPGSALGTPAYMAPEVATGSPPGPRSDLWSMGVVLYRLLSGHTPFAVGDALATLAAVARDAPTPLEARAPTLPRPLALAVDRALRPCHSRYADARAFARSLLEAALASGVELPGAPDPFGLPEWDRWMASAASSTGRAPVIEPTAIASSTSAVVSRTPRRMIGVVAAALLVTSTGVLLGMADEEPRTEDTPALTAPPEPSVPSSEEPAVPRPTGPLALPEPAPVEPSPREPSARRSARGSRPVTAPGLDRRAEDPHALPEIVTSWDL